MWWLQANQNALLFLVLLFEAAIVVSAMTSQPQTIYKNVLLASSQLVPFFGSVTVAHQTRKKVFDLLKETMARRKDNERSMIVDISATTWNWDTYAIVAGTPQPIKVFFANKETLMKHVHLDDSGIVQSGILVAQPSEAGAVCYSEEEMPPPMVWVPKGARLKSANKQEDGTEEFVLEAPIDPNDDRLEHWEQEVSGKQRLYKARAKLAHESMRNMMRFYDLDRIICWDLSWGIWEALRNRKMDGDDGFPSMTLVKEGTNGVPFPSFSGESDEETIQSLYDCCRPISQTLLAETLNSVSGYYLVGGNTYNMSLFHHMWDKQAEGGIEENKIGHMQLLRNMLAEGTLFYMGHSAGAIMAGPNILTATFKGIDAFSIVTQPYNEPFVRLPPSETPDTFYAKEKNSLLKARTKMLEKMNEYGAWRGYNVIEALAFPHYDSRPRFASFPQSAETYLRATDDEGRFHQMNGSLLVGSEANQRTEPKDVNEVREDTNSKELPCYPIANGHSIVFEYGGLKLVQALSPEEEDQGTMHWDSYMPNVSDKDYLQYTPGRIQFTVGAFTNDKNTMAGDRSSTSEYNGARIFSRLDALGLPNPMKSRKGDQEGLFRSTWLQHVKRLD